MKSPLSVFALLWLVSVGAAAELQLPDFDGKVHFPLRAENRKATVVIFTLPDCPVANAYAPEVNRLVTEYTARGVSFFLAHVDRDLTATDARKHAKDFGLECPVLLDSEHRLVKALGATKTPQAFLIGSEGKTLYRGRINNLYADYGQRRQVVTQHDLRNALDAVLTGKPISQSVTDVVGCHIQTISETKKTP